VLLQIAPTALAPVASPRDTVQVGPFLHDTE
jgi:hypothetical protein